jgi:uncharacterized protein
MSSRLFPADPDKETYIATMIAAAAAKPHLLVEHHRRQHGGGGTNMKIVRAMLLASAVGIGAVIPAAAQQAAAPEPSPEAIAAAKELIAVASLDKIKDMTSKMVPQMVINQRLLARFSIDATIDDATMDTLNSEIRPVVEKEVVTYVTTLADSTMPAFYARHLSVDEMKAIEAFYRSPVGAKLLHMTPADYADMSVDEKKAIEAFLSTPAGEKSKKVGVEVTGVVMSGVGPLMQRFNVAILDVLKKHGYEPKAPAPVGQK